MNNENSKLRLQMSLFDAWAESAADRRNSDWPMDYPEFDSLVEIASSVMRLGSRGTPVSDEECALIAKVFSR